MVILRLLVLLTMLLASFEAYAHGEEPVDLVKEIKDYLQRESGKAPSTEEVVDTLNLYVAGQFRDGNRRSAQQAAERALQYAEAELGAAHPATLQSMSNLAVIYDLQKHYDAAEPLYLQALAGRAKVLGPEHPDTRTTVENLATLYEAQGRNEEAELVRRRH